jgi:hypothetical protein
LLLEHEGRFQQEHRFHPFTSPKTKAIMAEREQQQLSSDAQLTHNMHDPYIRHHTAMGAAGGFSSTMHSYDREPSEGIAAAAGRHSSAAAAAPSDASDSCWRPLEALAHEAEDSRQMSGSSHSQPQQGGEMLLTRTSGNAMVPSREIRHRHPGGTSSIPNTVPQRAEQTTPLRTARVLADDISDMDQQKAAAVRELVRFGLHGTRVNVAYASPFRTPLNEQRDNGMVASSPKHGVKRQQHPPPQQQQQQRADDQHALREGRREHRASSASGRRYVPASTSVVTTMSAAGVRRASSPSSYAPPRGGILRGTSNDVNAATPPSRSPFVRSGTVTSSTADSRAVASPPPGAVALNDDAASSSNAPLQLDRGMVDELKGWWVELTSNRPAMHHQSGHHNLSLPTHDALLAAVELVTMSAGTTVSRRSALALLEEFPRHIVFADFVLLVEKVFALHQQPPRRLYH